MRIWKRFRKDDKGAVTVDWVVLAAAIVGLGVGLVGLIASAATDKSEGVGNRVETTSFMTFN